MHQFTAHSSHDLLILKSIASPSLYVHGFAIVAYDLDALRSWYQLRASGQRMAEQSVSNVVRMVGDLNRRRQVTMIMDTGHHPQAVIARIKLRRWPRQHAQFSVQ